MRLLNIPKKPLLESSLALACELLLAGGEMVCYNITAYNEIINFTVSKREVYNSKLRAGIKAERGMVMKGKNLERAVILGLLLSTGVYGTAWSRELTNAEISNNGNTVTITDEDMYLSNDDYPIFGDDKKTLGDFDTVIINQSTGYDGLDICTLQEGKHKDFSKTDFVITMTGSTSNSDALHLRNWVNNVKIHDFTAYVYSPNSDAINIGHESTSSVVEIIGDLTAEVSDGNGIRANSQINSSPTEMTSTIIVRGTTNITITGSNVKGQSILGGLITPTYDPAAVYAGDSAAYYNFFGTRGNESLGEGKIFLYGDTYLKTSGDETYGVLAGKNGNIVINNIDINATGKDAYGIAASNKNLIYGTNYDRSENKFGSSVTLNGDTNKIYMVETDADGNIRLDENGNPIQTEGSKAIYAESQYGIVKSGDNGIGNIDIIGDIVAEDGGTINLDITRSTQNWLQGDIIAYGTQSSKNASVNLTTNAALAYQGDALAANGGIVDVKLGNCSSWAGRADDYQDATNSEWLKNHTDNLDTKFSGRVTGSGTVKIDMGTGSFWNVTGQSWVTDLKGNNSYIILDNDENGNGYALHIGKITGKNTFAMNISPEDNGNMIYVKDGTGAQQNLIINNRDEVLQNMDVGDAVRFATVANAGMGFENGEFADMPVQTFGRSTRISDSGIFNVDFDIVYNDYEQDMQGDAADTEEDYNGDSFDKNKPGSDYVDKVYGDTDAQNVYIVRKSVTKENQSDAGKTIINMSRANYKNAIYMDRLNKRMGEMRYVNGEEEQGLWVRLRHDRIGQSGDFRSMNTMYEVGYDVKQPTDNGEHRIGMAIDYMRGSTTYDDIMGKGETKRYGLWLYDTWLGEKGHYVDYVAKWGHLSNDFDITAKTTGEKINGDYSNNVFSVSAEYGKKNDMGNNWYFEPQAQLQLARVTGADYVTTQGSKVNVDGINSLIGRAGFRIGRDMDENSTVYLKADLLHEFMGDQTVTAADATGTLREEFENKGTWYDVGVGFAAKMSKNSYAFMDFEKSFGNDNDETYQINAGMQWMF